MPKTNRISVDLGSLYPRLKKYHYYWGDVSSIIKRLVSDYLDKKDREEPKNESKGSNIKAT